MNNEIGKNKIMRTPKEKEKIVKRYLNGESATKLAKEIESTGKVIREWTRKYEKSGVDGLKSNTGKHKNKNNKNN